jgi:hypothetical protein
MNKSEEVIEGALRIGIGKFTTETEIEQASQIICEAIKDISMLQFGLTESETIARNVPRAIAPLDKQAAVKIPETPNQWLSGAQTHGYAAEDRNHRKGKAHGRQFFSAQLSYKVSVGKTEANDCKYSPNHGQS